MLKHFPFRSGGEASDGLDTASPRCAYLNEILQAKSEREDQKSWRISGELGQCLVMCVIALASRRHHTSSPLENAPFPTLKDSHLLKKQVYYPLFQSLIRQKGREKIRIAVLDEDRCKPNRCGRVCYRFCPKVRSNVEAIRFEGATPLISEMLCSGCGICVKKCPFKALSIVNLPDELEGECSHRFGPNAFRLFRLPVPSPSIVLGLLGQNGIGKSTVLRILSGNLKLNLGNYEDLPDWREIVQYYRGSTLQTYFQKLSREELEVVHKPQYISRIPEVASGKVSEVLEKVDERDQLTQLSKQLQLDVIWDRPLNVLSGGELQRIAIAATISREADVYLIDEPSSYLDVKQRLKVAKAIRSLKSDKKIVVVAEHDLAVLDYLSDQICVFYGNPGVYGIVSHVHGVRTGINIYLEGYIQDENMRFREEGIIFHAKAPSSGLIATEALLEWEAMEKTYEGFGLTTGQGEVRRGEVVGILGPNGIGKTTFAKLLAGIEKPDVGSPPTENKLSVSYKPQYISNDYEGTVEELLRSVAKGDFTSSWYRSEILQPFNLDAIFERRVKEISGGELQKVAIATCLSRDVDLYLLDEPSAYLDVEERFSMAKTVRRVVENRNASAFVVEHDIVAQDFIADRLMIFTGQPGRYGLARTPTNLEDGMNVFLKEMEVTFRRDPSTKRPRVNKEGSRLDRYQKKIGQYYYVK